MSRAKTLLGYEPQVSLSEGVQRLLHWYAELPLTPEQLLEQEVLHNWVSTTSVA